MITFTKIIAENAFMITDRTEILFKDGMCLVDGKNGSGKSTINKIIKLCISGKTDGEWTNRFTKKNHRVSLFMNDAVNSYELHVFKRYKEFKSKNDLYLNTYKTRNDDVIYIRNGVNLSRSADKKGTWSAFQQDTGFNENVFNYVNLMGGGEPYLPLLTDSVLKKKFDDIIHFFNDINEYRQRATDLYSEYQAKYNDWAGKSSNNEAKIEVKTTDFNTAKDKIEKEKLRLQQIHDNNERNKVVYESNLREFENEKLEITKQLNDFGEVAVQTPTEQEQTLFNEINKLSISNSNLISTKTQQTDNFQTLTISLKGVNEAAINKDIKDMETIITKKTKALDKFVTPKFKNESEEELKTKQQTDDLALKGSELTFKISELEKQILSLEQETKNPVCKLCGQKISVKQQKDQLKELKQQLKPLKTEKTKLDKDLEKVQKSLVKFIKERQSHNNSINEQLQAHQEQKQELENLKQNLENCKKVVSDFHIKMDLEKHIKELELEINKNNNTLSELNKSYLKLKETREQYNSQINTKLKEKQVIVDKLSQITQNINATKLALQNITDIDKSLLTSLRSDFTQIREDLGSLNSYKKTINKNLKRYDTILLHVNWVKDVLYANKGLKTSILQSMAAHMTNVANKTFKKYFGNHIDIDISTHTQLKTKDPDTGKPALREKFKITAINKNGADCFEGLSTGEKQMVNQCCIEAFGSLSRKFGKVAFNFMYGDETFTGLKGINVDNMIKYIKEKPFKTKLVTSHNDDVKEYFDDILEVTKDRLKGSHYKYAN